jgi:hypothetical protein
VLLKYSRFVNNSVMRGGAMNKTYKITTGIAIILFLVCGFVAVSGSFALEKGPAPQVVVGYIEDVSGSSVKVNGRYWEISGAPLYFKNGVRVGSELLRQGNGVEIVFEHGRAVRVTVNNARPAM